VTTRPHCLLERPSLPLKVEITVDAKESTDRIVEIPEVGRAGVLLNVAGVGIVQHVKHTQSGAELEVPAVELEVERILDFHIQADEGPETPCLVLLSNVVPVLVYLGERKSRVHIQHRNEVQLVRQPHDAPDQASVRSVGGHDGVLVGANKRIGDVAEELVVIIQVSSGARVDIAGVQGSVGFGF